ncbi:WD40-repeat-containing domain protein [Dimargaris cristalligena]|uniref:WD40-repeat-containing domain protein n=1 Tax=Dimargaris cristalligena TaxID=215637 RepID=A0A4P9ZL78_9FUNG|nr:WD40-repeat-containing domain protein [Dimargaris cristalligena]|eukprot:RKP33838.1 WD40-repeat-containing domain protein [Dimargaris cristalligena]
MAKGSFFETAKKSAGRSGGGPRHGQPAKAAGHKAGRGGFSGTSRPPKRKAPAHGDSEIESGSDSDDNVNLPGTLDEMDLRHRYSESESEKDEDEMRYGKESAAAKRLRLSKQYLASDDNPLTALQSEMAYTGDFFADDIDRGLIASRLIADVREKHGQAQRKVVDTVQWPLDINSVRTLRAHFLTVTAVAVAPSGRFMYSGSKDGSIYRWDLATARKTLVVKRGAVPPPSSKKGRKGAPARVNPEVLCLAVSHDNKFLASGGRDTKVRIWSTSSHQCLAVFHQHKDAITGLAFQQSGHNGNQLYSCSLDRMVKLWNVDQLSYMETLFGHQEAITDIATLNKDHAVTTGGRDRTLRLWKVVEESQLVFRGGANFNPRRGKAHSQVGVNPPTFPL